MAHGMGHKADDVFEKGGLEVARYGSAKPLPRKFLDLADHVGGRTATALPAIDQGSTMTCVAASITEVIYARLAHLGEPTVVIDTQKAYVMAQRWEMNRKKRKTPLTDGGLHPIDMVSMLSRWGACSIASPLPARDLEMHVLDDVWVSDYQRAATHAVSGWRRIADDLEPDEIVETAKRYLVAGFPGFDGADLDQGFMDYTGGVWTRDPAAKSKGLHATSVLGFDDDKRAFLCANHWSDSYGEDGFYWRSYETHGSMFVGDRYHLDVTGL